MNENRKTIINRRYLTMKDSTAWQEKTFTGKDELATGETKNSDNFLVTLFIIQTRFQHIVASGLLT
jgi:hypothetical protein|tara:strand:+ start:1258 stop:1455 length:198 start_codon:yes stop_codon:yes gene_type:complete